MFVTSQKTSQTFNFPPSGSEFVLAALARCQIRPAEMTQQHMFNARMALNCKQPHALYEPPNGAVQLHQSNHRLEGNR